MGGLFILFSLGLFSLVSHLEAIAFGVPVFLKILLVLPLMAALLAIGVLVFTVLAWKRKYWTVYGRVHYTLVFLAALAFFWFLSFWNLLGWKF